MRLSFPLTAAENRLHRLFVTAPHRYLTVERRCRDAEPTPNQRGKPGTQADTGTKNDALPVRKGRRVGRGAASRRGNYSPPVARCMMRSCVASARVNSPVKRPSCITRMRSLIPSTSGSSDEIMMIATPRATSAFINW